MNGTRKHYLHDFLDLFDLINNSFDFALDYLFKNTKFQQAFNNLSKI